MVGLKTRLRPPGVVETLVMAATWEACKQLNEWRKGEEATSINEREKSETNMRMLWCDSKPGLTVYVYLMGGMARAASLEATRIATELTLAVSITTDSWPSTVALTSVLPDRLTMNEKYSQATLRVYCSVEAGANEGTESPLDTSRLMLTVSTTQVERE